MSEDQDLLARISQLAGHINLHKSQPSAAEPSNCDPAANAAPGQYAARGQGTWRSPRQAPYRARGRGAPRRYPTNHSLVLNKGSSQLPSANAPATPDKNEVLQPAAAYVSKRGRHKQLINSSVLDKVMQQRRQAIESSQHRKALVNDQRERRQMRHYLEGLHAGQSSSNAQGTAVKAQRAYIVMTLQRLRYARAISRGELVQQKNCGLPHVDRAGQIRRQAAHLAETNDISDSLRLTEANQSDISSDEENGAERDGEDVDSDDLADDFIEGVDVLGRQALAEQHDFVGF
ncbi:MAG: hypothetical protein Q9216_003203 [Gyalolechia sp. 2 TL-2023]